MGFPIEKPTGKAQSAIFGQTAGLAGVMDAIGSPETADSMSPARWIAAAGGLGLAPVAPGTFGSVGGALLFLGMLELGAQIPVFHPAFHPTFHPALLAGIYLALVGFLFGLGVWASGRAELEWGRHDDNRIVIDEVVGQLIALSPLVWFCFFEPQSLFEPKPLGTSSLFSLFAVVTGFVLFRVFDVWKPGPIRWAERRFESGLGVMADDGVAGICSAVVLYAGLRLYFGWFGFGTEGLA